MAKLNGDLYVGETGRQLKDLGGGSPIGTIEIYSGNVAPEGYLFCHGQAVSRTTYAELFEAIGTTYGTGDGSTTFNLPNLKGRIPVGQDTSDTSFDVLGETGGEKTHLLTAAESGLPSHNHDQYVGANSGSWGVRADYNSDTRCSSYPQGKTGSTGGTNASNAHNNLQPYLVINYVIKAFNIASAPSTSQVRNTYSDSTTDVYSCHYANQVNIDMIYPVGSIYLTVDSMDPNVVFGGTWVKMSGGYLYGCVNSIDNSSYTGTGTQPHKLTAAQSGLPSHRHEIQREQNSKASGSNWDWGGPGGFDSNIHSYTSYSGGSDASQAHSHNVAYIGVWVWKRIS